jgi:tetratricopeptide (TPR) repeat protein
MPDQVRIFVSHSHKDDRFTKRLVTDLTRAGADVWVDKVGIDHGNFMQVIDQALSQCEWLALVLTPNAIASEHVKTEVFAALNRVHNGYMRGVIPILAAPCQPGSIPPMWDALQRYDATRRLRPALAELLPRVGLSLSNVDGLLSRSDDHCNNDQYDDALPLLERATRLAPDNFDAWHNLGYVRFMLGQYDDALTANDRALHINPYDGYAWYYRSITLSTLWQNEESLAAIDCSLALEPRIANLGGAWSLRGDLLNRLKQHDEALSASDRALTLEPQDAEAWHNKGDALRGLRRQEEAVAAYEQALAIDPTNAETRRNKSYSLRAIARRAQAQEAALITQEVGE